MFDDSTRSDLSVWILKVMKNWAAVRYYDWKQDGQTARYAARLKVCLSSWFRLCGSGASAPAAVHHHSSMLSVTVIISSGCSFIVIQQAGMESKKYSNWPENYRDKRDFFFFLALFLTLTSPGENSCYKDFLDRAITGIKTHSSVFFVNSNVSSSDHLRPGVMERGAVPADEWLRHRGFDAGRAETAAPRRQGADHEQPDLRCHPPGPRAAAVRHRGPGVWWVRKQKTSFQGLKIG